MSISTVLKFKSLEAALTGNTGSTVNNASLVRVVSSSNNLVYVVNSWSNNIVGNTDGTGGNVTPTGGMMVLAGSDYLISKYPGDLLIANGTGVNATSVAFRE
jgi:hypothetical protein